jgi:hypothetical protein
MAIPVNDIVVGRCYATSLGQVRRVLEIVSGKITYEEDAKTASSGVSTARTTIGIENFARQVSNEVPCENGGRRSSAGWT